MLLSLLILLFTSIMVVAIWVARQAAEKEKAQLMVRQKARLLKDRLDDLTDISTTLLRYDGDETLLRTIGDFRIAQARQRIDLLADKGTETQTDPELTLAQGFCDDLPQALADRTGGLPASDNDVNQMKRQFFRAIKLIKLMQTQGYFMNAEAVEHARRLRVLVLKADVFALVQHGRQLLKDEDRVNAAAYFKHAKELLAASNHRFPERSSMIRRISRMIWGMYSSSQDDIELDRELGLLVNEEPDPELAETPPGPADPQSEAETSPVATDATSVTSG